VRYLDEYRDADAARGYAAAIRAVVTKPWVLMEICGGQTHSIVRYGIDQLLPPEIELVHGPGCPVCVTPIGQIDHAIDLAKRPNHIVCSFGDMLRVPGSKESLMRARADGAEVRIVYSPLDAVAMAAKEPDKEFTFFAVGFETTAPANALAVKQAKAFGLTNFTLLTAHVCVPPAMEAILSSEGNRVQGFLAAGHVCAVMGAWEYPPIAARHKVPIVVTGFEPVDLLLGVLKCVTQLEEGRHEVENAYSRAVQHKGNPSAMAAMEEVFEPADQTWRGIGEIPLSGLRIRSELASFDAEIKFGLAKPVAEQASECKAALVLQGRLKPHECPAFGVRCTPETPLGAPMVSSEGACAAYHRYRSRQEMAS
jgi:hydrogenase expression/formation protein HypD